jgi:hypothetical protein
MHGVALVNSSVLIEEGRCCHGGDFIASAVGSWDEFNYMLIMVWANILLLLPPSILSSFLIHQKIHKVHLSLAYPLPF